MAIAIVLALLVGFVLVPLMAKMTRSKPPIPGWAFALLFIVMFMLGMVRG